MQYSMFDELAASLRLAALERIELSHRAEAELLFPRPGLRESVASALVRLGASLDRDAIERARTAAAARAH